MSFAVQILLFFLILCFVSLLVYFLVVWAFYWGDKKDPPANK